MSGGGFTLEFPLVVVASLFDPADKHSFEFGVDVFQAASGSDEVAPHHL